jgi:exonuclease III
MVAGAGAIRIDWILLRDGRLRWTVAACDLLYDAEPPLYSSDHFPLLADLALAK